MKTGKKIMAFSLAVVMGLSLCACGKTGKTSQKESDGSSEEASAQSTDEPVEIGMPEEVGDTIYVYSWNSELGERLEYFKQAYPQYADRVEFVNLGLDGNEGEYKVAIETLLQANYNGTDKYPSIVAMNSESELEYVQSDYTVSLDTLGITREDMQNMFPYTIEFSTFEGTVKALTWQAAPNCFLYRTDMAEEILGASDPESVQEAVTDWNTFLEMADKMKAAGYKMVSGPDDIKYGMLAQKKNAWVTDEILNVDPVVTGYLESAKKLYDGDYTNHTTVGDAEWEAGFDGDVFGWFVSPQYIYQGIHAEKHIGEFNVCQGPSVYSRGETYLNVAKGCPDMALAALVLKTLCCDEQTLTKIAEETGDFVNNKAVMKKISDDGKGSLDMLGDQDPIPVWMKAAEAVDVSRETQYDARMNEYLDAASQAYNSGQIRSAKEAVELIKDYVTEAYNYITVK